MDYTNLLKLNSFYLVGIGGVSMSALAKYLLSSGKIVGGCDDAHGDNVIELENLGVKITIGTSDDVASFDVVVYTDAVPQSHSAIYAAKTAGKVIVSRGEFLAAVASSFRKVIAVAGCHGKTTCTAMLSHIFYGAGKKFACHIGGKDLKFGNFFMNGGDYFVTEACEYKKNFLLLEPTVAVVLNSDADHMECYGTVEQLKNCYKRYASNAKNSVGLYGDIPCGVTFGFNGNADYSASDIFSDGGRYSFSVCKGGSTVARIKLAVYGKHNVLNALAAYAASDILGISGFYIAEGLKNFKGVKRRFEYLGTYGGAACIADYAHHPDEIKVTLKTVHEAAGGRLFVVFQPHTYSRTKNLFDEFIAVFNPLKRLLIYKTFAAREYYDDGGSAYTLSLTLKKSRYGDCLRDIKNFLYSVREGDVVLFLGAGDIYDIAVGLIKNQ